MTELTRPLVVVANRLPVSRGPDGWHPSAGGLVTAMRPVIDQVGGAWIGWDDDPDGVPSRVEGLACDLLPVELSRAQVRGYYHGLANRTLWPLFHDLVAQPVIERRWWRTYEEANRLFAERVTEAAAASEVTPMVWVQDYHLTLLPAMVRGLVPDAPIGFFLHTPFPPPELFARLPWRDQVLQGMLAADAVGFHTPQYRDNFVRSVQRLFHGVTVLGDQLNMPDGRQVRAVAHPISIDTEEFTALASSPDTESEYAELREQFEGRKVFLGVDRLDYTKGIRHRLQSIEMLLERNPELRRRFAFVQIAVPSRDDVQEYRDLRTQVETEVGRINGRFTEPGQDVPVHYLYRGVPRESLAAYYRLADVMCVTPLKDGMNLVAKEFVTIQAASEGAGVLLLSEFCGTSIEFGDDAVRSNPFDVESQSYLMESALELDADDRRDRIARMAETVREADVFRWVDDELAAIERGRSAP
ncbi:MAG: alpha,alpha-trehalose-phosphate synthase (UDP-forming) [Actinomycetota bacterium]